MDTRTPEKRSEIMSLVRGKHTRPELAVRRLVSKLGYRYRLYAKGLPGKPDLCFPGRGKIIFVHGCFWHAHSGCRGGRPPKSRFDYWLPKLRETKLRDKRTLRALARLGWATLVIWQCEVQSVSLSRRIRRFLGPAAVSRGGRKKAREKTAVATVRSRSRGRIKRGTRPVETRRRSTFKHAVKTFR
jgi:DNA mismatch endonuclease (patch repair protein)